jgi:hypothetical protein
MEQFGRNNFYCNIQQLTLRWLEARQVDPLAQVKLVVVGAALAVFCQALLFCPLGLHTP